MLATALFADSCWNKVEIAGFAQDEFSEKARFSIKDAVTCTPIAGALIILNGKRYKTDAYGQITVPLPDEDIDRNLPIQMKKAGYITANEKVMTVFGSYWNNLFLMSKDLPIKSSRFVLSWSNTPNDLDLHLKSDAYHISYRHTKNISGTAKLDRDARHGYGPETITVDKLNKNNNYRVLVFKYSNSGTINNKAQVRVYANGKLDNIVRLPNTNAKCIEVATIHNNKISYEVKELSNSECK